MLATFTDLAWVPLAAAAGCLLALAVVPRQSREALTAVVFLTGLALGLLGFLQHQPPSADGSSSQRVADAIFNTLQLITLNVSAEETQGTALNTARLLLPLATAQAIVLVLLSRIQQWHLRARLLFGSPETIVFGCGEIGLQLADFYANHYSQSLGRGLRWRAGRAPAVLGVDHDAARLGNAIRSGGLRIPEFEVMRETLDLSETMRTVRAMRAKRIIISSEDEQENLALLRAYARLGASGGGARREQARRPEVIVSVHSGLLAKASQFNHALANLPVHHVNIPRLEARLLLQQYPPHRVHPQRFRVNRRNRCHIVLLGQSAFIEELAAHAVRALVYDPEEPLRVSVLTADAATTAKRFFARFPALNPAAPLHHPAYGGQLPIAHIAFFDTYSTPINANALFEVHQQQAVDVIYVAGRTDDETCALQAEALKAADAIAHPRPHVVACLAAMQAELGAEHVDLGQVDVLVRPQDRLNGSEDPLRLRLLTFARNQWQTPRNGSQYPDDFADHFAKAVWSVYLKSQGGTPSPELWNELRPQERWWNRCSGDHAALKYDLLGIAAGDEDESLQNALGESATVAWLRRLEHRRYVNERYTDGWLNRPLDSSTQRKFNAYQLNPTLLHNEVVPPSDLIKDDAIVSLLHTLKAIADQRTREQAAVGSSRALSAKQV